MGFKILLLNGPNLNMLGIRDPSTYGPDSLETIVKDLKVYATERDVELRDFQSNSEGALVDAIHDAYKWADGIVFQCRRIYPLQYCITGRDCSCQVACRGGPPVKCSCPGGVPAQIRDRARVPGSLCWFWSVELFRRPAGSALELGQQEKVN